MVNERTFENEILQDGYLFTRATALRLRSATGHLLRQIWLIKVGKWVSCKKIVGKLH